MDQKTEYKVYNKLNEGWEAKEVAEQLEVSYSAVLRLRKKFEESKLNGQINQLLNIEEAVIEEVVEELVADSDLPAKLKGLERLSSELQQTASLINNKVRIMVQGVDTINELEIAAEVICKLQSSFVNVNSTQVNIQNNYSEQGEKPKYTEFLSDKPGG